MLRELLAVRISSSGQGRSLRCPGDGCGHRGKELPPALPPEFCGGVTALPAPGPVSVPVPESGPDGLVVPPELLTDPPVLAELSKKVPFTMLSKPAVVWALAL